jgi:hypothetical protein
MTDERDLAEAAMRGDHARRLLDDPVLVEMFTRLEDHYVSTWRRSDPSDSPTRERAYLQIQLVAELRQQLKVLAENGQLSRSLLDRLRIPRKSSN